MTSPSHEAHLHWTRSSCPPGIEDQVIALVDKGPGNSDSGLDRGSDDRSFCDRAFLVGREHAVIVVVVSDNTFPPVPGRGP